MAETKHITVVLDNRAVVSSKIRNGVKVALDVIGAKVESKAKVNCPVDTGRLRNSITHALASDTEVRVGAHTDYAAFVELGTSRRGATPYLKPAVESISDSEIAAAFKAAIGG